MKEGLLVESDEEFEPLIRECVACEEIRRGLPEPIDVREFKEDCIHLMICVITIHGEAHVG